MHTKYNKITDTEIKYVYHMIMSDKPVSAIVRENYADYSYYAARGRIGRIMHKILSGHISLNDTELQEFKGKMFYLQLNGSCHNPKKYKLFTDDEVIEIVKALMAGISSLELTKRIYNDINPKNTSYRSLYSVIHSIKSGRVYYSVTKNIPGFYEFSLKYNKSKRRCRSNKLSLDELQVIQNMVLDGKCVGDIKAAINRDDIKKQYLNSIMAEIKYRRYSSITSKLLTDIPPELSLEEINLYLEKHKTNMPDTSIPLEELKYYELLLALDRGEDYFTIMALYKK